MYPGNIEEIIHSQFPRNDLLHMLNDVRKVYFAFCSS
jgi:hypothetical protein